MYAVGSYTLYQISSEGLASVSMEYGFYFSVVAFLAAVALQFIPMEAPPEEAPAVSEEDGQGPE